MNVTAAPASAEPLLLVADDDHDNADQLALLLQTALQCEVVTAYDGGDALAQALARLPVAMVLDMEMPVLSGAEVARQVRAACQKPPLLVAVSGNAAALGASQVAAEPVFDRSFGKPLRFEQLLAVLVERAGLVAQ
jgi:two-component system KDP operon response regulator KdpE